MNKKLISILSVMVMGITLFTIKQLTMINDEKQVNIVDNSINIENRIERNNKNQIGEANTEKNTENIITSDITENNVERMENMKLYIKVNNRTLTATLNDNSSARALVSKLESGSITIDMEDYSRMEKVGSLGFSLPRNDESINTEAGDLILYQGNSFVIYYDNNSWSLTRLGKIDNITQKELKEILGTGSVEITLSIEE